jgi:translocator protein
MSEIALPGQLRMSYLRWALICAPLILLLGLAAGSLSGSGEDNGWYAALIKPDFTPPGWAFPLVWTTLYLLMGLALALICHARGAKGRGLAISFFAVQFLLNLSWSPIFFAAHQIEIALWVIIAMALTALLTAILFWRIRKVAGLLLLPYLAWLGLATMLNAELARLNPEASQRGNPAATVAI